VAAACVSPTRFGTLTAEEPPSSLQAARITVSKQAINILPLRIGTPDSGTAAIESTVRAGFIVESAQAVNFPQLNSR
jgi:hypothetical protein